MDHEEFVRQLAKPWYVWRMAWANRNAQMLRSRGTRMANAQRVIDQLVLARAAQIEKERQDASQCTSISRGDDRVRCEHPPGHGPVPDNPKWNGSPWDHSAPSSGVYWNEARRG